MKIIDYYHFICCFIWSDIYKVSFFTILILNQAFTTLLMPQTYKGRKEDNALELSVPGLCRQ